MQLNQLRSVIKISECGSFSAAAKELFISQPSLSQQIIKLETELGVKLFERNASRLHLTEAGNCFVQDAKMVLQYFDGIQENMSAYRVTQKDVLHIGLMRSLQHRHLVHRLREVKEGFPKVSMDIHYQDSATLRGMLASRQLDAAFLLPADAQDLADISIWELPYRFYALLLPQNPLSQYSSIGYRDLKGQRFLLPEQNNYIFSEVVHLISQVEMDVEVYLPRAGEEPLDERTIAFVPQGGSVPPQYHDCEIVPLEFFDLYGICLAVCSEWQENEVIRALLKVFL